MKTWLERQFAQIPPRGSLADAIRYTISRWELLCRFLNDGRVELDTNTVERAIRPVTLGRKNLLIPEQAAHLFRDDVARPFRLIVARHSD